MCENCVNADNVYFVFEEWGAPWMSSERGYNVILIIFIIIIIIRMCL
jgi:hypothetical protein